jgi:WD40 repeat protein
VGAWQQDESLRIWDTRYQSKLGGWRAHDGHVRGVAYSRDGSVLYSAGDDGSVRAWNAQTHQLAATLVFHQAGLSSLRLSPDGTRLSATSFDGALIITTLPEGEPSRTIRFPHTGGLLAAEWTPDGRHVLTVNADGTAYLVRLEERGK